MNIQLALQERLRAALTGLVPDPTPFVSMFKPTQDPRFGDYQANCAMSLASSLASRRARSPRRSSTAAIGRLSKRRRLPARASSTCAAQ